MSYCLICYIYHNIIINNCNLKDHNNPEKKDIYYHYYFI